jgi:glycosyltransferase involved in cell wall biosynthesis
MKKPRILFLTNTIGTGGVGNQLYNLTKRLESRGYNIKIISLRSIGQFGKQTAASGVDVASLGINKKITFPIALYQIRQVISAFNPEIIHTHLFHANILGRISAIKTNTTTISTIHNTRDQTTNSNNNTIRTKMYSFTDSVCDLTTFVGKNAMNQYIESGATSAENAIHIYNGIDTNFFARKNGEKNSKKDNKPFRWIIVGNLLKHKGHKILLHAFNSLEDYNTELMIVGGGKLEKNIKQLSEELGVSQFVSFEGRVPPNKVPVYLRSADAFVLSSLHEGFGLVVGEAMACELPVVATDTSGPSEIIVDGETGFLAERGSPEDLASQMEKMMQLSPNERARFGAQGRERIKNKYSIEQTVSKWIKIYDRYT